MPTPRLLPALVRASLGLALVAAPGARADDAPLFPACSAPFGEIDGAEDFEIDTGSAAAPRILASGSVRRPRDGPGALVSIPLAPDGTAAGPTHVLASELAGCPLRPHGVSLTRGSDGVWRFYAIHHASPEDDGAGHCVLPRDADGDLVLHSVVVYRLEGDGLVEEQVLRDALLPSPNDLYALPDGTLYVTNEITHQGFLPMLGEVLGMADASTVVHYDPRRSDAPWRRVASGLRFANGVIASDERVYVASLLDEEVRVYRRDAASGELPEELAPIPIGSLVDNLVWESPPTRFVATSHVSLLAFLRHARDASVPAPWEAWRVDVGGAAPVLTLLARVQGGGPGGDASATAAVYGDALYAGQVFERGLVRCTAAR